MAKKKSEYSQTKFDNRKYDTVKETEGLNNDKTASKLDNNLDIIFKETIVALKENKDFLKKLTDEANEQMSRCTFKVSSK